MKQTPLDKLVSIALAGLNRVSLSPGTFNSPNTPGSELLTRLESASSSPEAFLRLGAASILLQEVAFVPSPLPGIHPVEACGGNEELPPCSDRAAHLLERLLDIGHAGVVHEWLQLSLQAGRSIPPALLVPLFEFAFRADRPGELRVQAVRASGTRGAWLSALVPDWQGGTVETASRQAWETGTPAVRLSWFQAYRTESPAAARDLLQGAFKTFSARERPDLLMALLPHLSLEDEPFLESCFTDRSTQVRTAVRHLLACLPDSAFSRRTGERLARFVRLETGLPTDPLLAVDPPDVLDPEMKRDGFEFPTADSSRKKTAGPKAQLLRNLLEYTCPAHWEQVFQCPPAEILALAEASEWKYSLVGALESMISRHRDPAWAEALLQCRALERKSDLLTSSLAWYLSSVPDEKKIDIIRNQFPSRDHQAFILQTIPGPWGQGLVRWVCTEVVTPLAQSSRYNNYHLYPLLDALAALGSPDSLPVASDSLEALLGKDSAYEERILRALELYRIRAELLQEFPPIPNPFKENPS